MNEVKNTLQEYKIINNEGELIDKDVTAFVEINALFEGRTQNVNMLSYCDYADVDDFKESVYKVVDELINDLKKSMKKEKKWIVIKSKNTIL